MWRGTRPPPVSKAPAGAAKRGTMTGVHRARLARQKTFPPPENMNTLQIPSNPIFDAPVRTVKPDAFASAHVFRAEQTTEARELRRLFRRETAAEFIGDVESGMHVFGLSKGQFSLVDVLRHLSDQIGRCRLSLSTWTVARADLDELQELTSEARFSAIRLLIDFSFQRRQPGLIATIRRRFGSEAVVVTRNHCKFLLMAADRFHLVCRTSMNLNFNPRLEDVEIKDDAELYQFLDDILNDIFARHEQTKQSTQTTAELAADFERLTI